MPDDGWLLAGAAHDDTYFVSMEKGK